MTGETKQEGKKTSGLTMCHLNGNAKVQSGAEVKTIFLNVDKPFAEKSPRPGHSRVAATIKTQGGCLHLKDTKYQHNNHERAHPSHCRQLFCQHYFALQTIILPERLDLDGVNKGKHEKRRSDSL